MEEWLAVSMAADKPRSLAITMLTHLHIMRLIRVVYSIFLPYTIFLVTSYHQSVFTCHGLIVQYLILCNAIIPLSICIWFLKYQVWNIHFSPFKTRILQATTGKKSSSYWEKIPLLQPRCVETGYFKLDTSNWIFKDINCI